MSEVAAIDPFYEMKPKQMWITVSSCSQDRKLRVILEVNGVEKELFSSVFPFEEGTVLQSTNLTGWLKK